MLKHRRNDTLSIDVNKFVTQPKWPHVTILWQEELTMSKRQKKKAPVVEEEPEVEVVTKTEYIYEDTKCISGVEPEYQWGEIYRLITRREVPDMGLEEESIYANIERSSLMRIATRLELFLCAEVIGWILPRADVTTMILEMLKDGAMLHIALDMWHWLTTCQKPKCSYLMTG